MRFFATRSRIKELLAEIRSKATALEECERELQDLRSRNKALWASNEGLTTQVTSVSKERDLLKVKVREQSSADLLLEAFKIQAQIIAGLTPSLSDQEQLHLTKQRWLNLQAQGMQNVYGTPYFQQVSGYGLCDMIGGIYP